ncbi:hypothetical protein ACXN5S_00035 [Pseudoroseicyclus sp. H15]
MGANAVASMEDRSRRIDGWEETGPPLLPIQGSATYNGGFVVSDMRVNGQSGYGLAGTSTVNIEFTNVGFDAVTGNVRDINFTQGGVPTERLSGTLVLSHGAISIDTQDFYADLKGTLTGGFGTTRQSDVYFDLDLEGTTHTDGTTLGQVSNPVYSIHGEVEGVGSGDLGVTIDGDNGALYGSR